MAIGTKSDFVIYDEEYYAGMYEKMAQNVDAFNEASSNSIRLVQMERKGDYEKEAFIDQITNLITRRDTTSTSDATAVKMTMDELTAVKLNRKIGPVDQTLDSWKKISKDQREMSYILGQMIAEEKLHDFLESAVRACEAALSGVSALVYDATGQSTTTMTATHLVSGMAKMGDMANRLICWVMHSKVYFDLVKQALSDKIYQEAGVVVYGGSPGTLGKPVVVTDCDGLYVGADSNYSTYQTLGLVSGGVVVNESEQETLVYDNITGKENLIIRVQGEYAFNVGLKGFAWDVTNGGANPTDNDLAYADYWDKVFAEAKNCAGVRIVTT